jgi:3-hydroxyacyl-CoA dehydrogenase
MSWAAYFLARGLTVHATDPDPAAQARTHAYIAQAWPVLQELDLVVSDANVGRIDYFTQTPEAVRAADFVQENGPERIKYKTELIAEIDAIAPAQVIIGSSTSALSATQLQSKCRHPERFIIAHPFNPPHLIPLVELCGGDQTHPAALAWAQEFFEWLERKPIVLAREVYGHVANRLQYVLYNEAVRLFLDGVASVKAIETAVTFGPGLRWPFAGPFLTHHLAGGAKGIRGAFELFEERDRQTTDRAGRLVLSPDQKELTVRGIREATADRSIDDLMDERDEALRELLKALRRLGRLGPSS